VTKTTAEAYGSGQYHRTSLCRYFSSKKSLLLPPGGKRGNKLMRCFRGSYNQPVFLCELACSFGVRLVRRYERIGKKCEQGNGFHDNNLSGHDSRLLLGPDNISTPHEASHCPHPKKKVKQKTSQTAGFNVSNTPLRFAAYATGSTRSLVSQSWRPVASCECKFEILLVKATLKPRQNVYVLTFLVAVLTTCVGRVA
jgi:hypothetical protein